MTITLKERHLESKIQSKIKKNLESDGWKVIKIIQLSENGYPDLMAMKNGEIVFIEVKREGCKPSPLQLLRIEQLKKNGFKSLWTDDKDFRLT